MVLNVDRKFVNDRGPSNNYFVQKTNKNEVDQKFLNWLNIGDEIALTFKHS